MRTKEKLLELFENNKGSYFSGADIAEKFSISRTAVWKSVKALRKEGYQIDAVQNKGYCLSVDTDILSVQGIQKYLNTICPDMELNVYPILDSTNAVVREKAIAGGPEGYIVIANSQTRGRGRSGRTFYSPSNTGIYMSLLLRPRHFSSHQAAQLTTMAAVAVCEAIGSLSGEKAQIKWVNDIYLRGKKVCGILTEGSLSLEDGSLEYAVLGIGINVSPPTGGFPDEIKDIAGTVFYEAQRDGKNRLAAEVLNRFMAYYSASNMLNYVDNYRQRSMVIGKEIQVIFPGYTKRAIAHAIDQNCHLIVEYEDGQTETLYSGEISIKITQ